MAFDPREYLKRRNAHPEPASVPVGGPLGGSRSERMQRLQVGGLGILGMVLLIGLADVIGNRVQETDASVVPEAAPTVEPSGTPTAGADPLVEAGVAPALPATPTPSGSSAPQTQPTGDVPDPTSNAQLQ
ncbi:hypothetical protein [Erythrobacter sp. EC-HK427]|uniref:hypothetical protein n=1 Tax=Erythrobacter sp. EC-HK427 TaxID=2038396 RepID=UPI00125B71EC|nr:hypothetical protein [Erythrobacter sp. EC-HK427]VVS97557.1 conserved hypothetical protein [Erythrobacter sp. EC-HK427]